MAQGERRDNALLASWLRAIAIALITWAAMSAMHARPVWLPAAIAIAAGVLALASAEAGVLVGIFGLCVPLLAAHPIVGILVTIALFSAEHYLAGGGASRFLLLGLAVAGAWFGPVWAAPALAGYLLGAVEGGMFAAVACVAVEAIGLVTARAAIGAALTGGAAPALVTFAHAPDTLLSSAWVSESLKRLSTAEVNRFFDAFAHMVSPGALAAQIAVWVLAAVVSGVVIARAGKDRPLWLALAAAGAGVGVAWLGDFVLRLGVRLAFSPATSGLAVASSLVVAGVVVTLREKVFAPVVAPVQVTPAPATMAAEDADVDELLRLIATAEDKLATQHTSERVVLITDMKSFSRMTEEDGSVASAKAIQRHRDLLVPIISANNGCGKSTGGDGVVAAFESAADAVRAAVEGQRALSAHNTAHPHERELWVRMGLASGEVVLDNGGRPFIGTGLNLAARVMNLADGGQIFATGAVIGAAGEAAAPSQSFGAFELKNIAAPVEIGEVLWAEGQQPRDPRTDANPTA